MIFLGLVLASVTGTKVLSIEPVPPVMRMVLLCSMVSPFRSNSNFRPEELIFTGGVGVSTT